MLRMPRTHFTQLDPEYFETINRYRPGRELLDIVEQCNPEGWQLEPGGFWSYCKPAGYVSQIQGWKIHISGMRTTASELLKRIVPLLVSENIAFKFCSDLRMVRLSNNKNWPRTGAGKFMTIYPDNPEQFASIIERLAKSTSDMVGPYILSDRRYKDSKVVFYRYGEHKGLGRVNAHGERIPCILAPDGTRVSDERVAFFRVPPWITDPLGGNDGRVNFTNAVLLKGRYRVTGAIRYSARGGIYIAEDLQSGSNVVVREARPLLDDPAGPQYAFRLLEKGARILQKLEATMLVPKFVDLFQEWEHLFLVEEHLEAESLWGHAMRFTADRATSSRDLFKQLKRTVQELVRGLEVVHSHDVLMRDLTKSNVLFKVDGQIKFVDFEFAYESDRDDPPFHGWTEGYASPEQLRSETPTVREDHYALGGLILDIITFTASGLGLNRSGILAALKQRLEDLGLPGVIFQAVSGLTTSSPNERWGATQVLEAFDSVPVMSISTAPFESARGTFPPERPLPTEELKKKIRETVEGIRAYILSKIDYGRDDRLWPCSPDVFLTNPVSFEFGATGIAFYLFRTGGSIPDGVLEWILKHTSPQTCPPGLYMGISGISLLFLEIGQVQKAKELLERSYDIDRIHEVPGLYEGASGWGLASLLFWKKTKEELYLSRAIKIGKQLLANAKFEQGSAYWESGGTIPLGLGFGASGVASFLVYLAAEAHDTEFLELAKSAVDFDIANATWVSEAPLWYPTRDAAPDTPKSPHMRHGTCGVGTAAIRLFMATGETRYRRFADICATTVCSRFTNKLWQDYGPSGYGEFLLDMYSFLGDETYLNNAFYIADGILPYRMHRPEGIAFPGPELLRISCDFGMGSGGIGLFFQRLLNPNTGRIFLPEEILMGQHARNLQEIKSYARVAE